MTHMSRTWHQALAAAAQVASHGFTVRRRDVLGRDSDGTLMRFTEYQVVGFRGRIYWRADLAEQAAAFIREARGGGT